jgi:DNA-binding MarR family transcriptional regulator
MSSDNLADLLADVGDRARALQSSVDALDQAVADHLGINRTDLRCLDELLRGGPTGPAHLASRLGLTTGSMTTLLDRLERAGYVVRSPDPTDRRRLLVHPTEKIHLAAARIYGPIASEGARDLAAFTAGDLAVVLRYLAVSHELQERHVERVRALGHGEGKAS